jgi:hypothetical protein
LYKGSGLTQKPSITTQLVNATDKDDDNNTVSFFMMVTVPDENRTCFNPFSLEAETFTVAPLHICIYYNATVGGHTVA